ncbi:NAD-P-binding protein [Daedaleopsis nitida]|nr:NAD-P-binding protein [Daedaleopsis nitida]
MSSAQEYVWFITGTNRGIGLEMTRQLLGSTTNTIIATCRNPSKASFLNELATSANGKLHIVSVDMDDTQSIRACADEVTRILGGKGIDYLINNAGIKLGDEEDGAFTVEVDALQKTFLTNVSGPAYLARAFLPLVEKSQKKTIVNVSSILGSVGSDCGGFHTTYSISKAALNMLTYKQAKERPDITTITIWPGWLQTDMGGSNAPDPVEVGVEGTLKTIKSLTPQNSGQFFNYKGELMPW